MKTLIIDDSRAMRRILRQIVEPLGFQVTEAGDGIEGLNRLVEMGHVDVVFVDWNMPVMNGLEFVRAIRAHADYQTLKVVMVTSETEPSKMARAQSWEIEDVQNFPCRHLIVGLYYSLRKMRWRVRIGQSNTLLHFRYPF